MARGSLRDSYFDSLGATHVYKTGTAHTTAASVIAAAGAGKRIRIKAFRCVLADANTVDTALNLAWLADGTTAFLSLAAMPLQDNTAGTVKHEVVDTGIQVLPGAGLAGTANTAVNIDFTAIDALLSYQLDIWYDVIDVNGVVQ